MRAYITYNPLDKLEREKALAIGQELAEITGVVRLSKKEYDRMLGVKE